MVSPTFVLRCVASGWLSQTVFSVISALIGEFASFQKSFDTLIAGLAKKTKSLGRDLVASR